MSNSWIGVKNKRSPYGSRLTKISILPRNNLNVIERGHEYELFYYDKGWKSLGRKKTDNLYIEFDNVPVNAVMLLRNLTEGKQERIFTYENYYQLFW